MAIQVLRRCLTRSLVRSDMIIRSYFFCSRSRRHLSICCLRRRTVSMCSSLRCLRTATGVGTLT